MTPRKRTSGTMVIGLGRFGEAVAAALDAMDKEVLAVETNRRLVQHFTGLIPIIEADATDADALEQAGAADFSSVVVGVGSRLEASVLITANLVDMGVEDIWAKAISPEHGRILKRIGAHHVIYPEFDAGRRTAHLVGSSLLDYVEMDKKGFAVAKLRPPQELDGFSLGQAKVESRFGVRVVAVLSPGEPAQYPTADTVIDNADVLVVSGSATNISQFASRPR